MPGPWPRREPVSHIGFICELRYHALDNTEFPTDQAIQEVSVVAMID